MIDIEELKPVLEGLLDGREDQADIIDKIKAMDKPVEIDRSEIDELNASWNKRYMEAFFGAKGVEMDGKPITEDAGPAAGAPDNAEGGVDEDISISDLFVEEKED